MERVRRGGVRGERGGDEIREVGPESRRGGSSKMAATEEEPKPKKLKVEAPRALR